MDLAGMLVRHLWGMDGVRALWRRWDVSRMDLAGMLTPVYRGHDGVRAFWRQ